MHGKIYSGQKCPECGCRFKFSEDRHGLFCKNHPNIQATKLFLVCYKGLTWKRFNTFYEAERYLTFIRASNDKGSYDPRDYKASAPLGFSNLADQWLESKRQGVRGKTLKPSTIAHLSNYIGKAKAVFGNKNVKDVREIDIEDFLFGLSGISEKTRANYRSALHNFFNWVRRRERIAMPEFPDVPYELGYRKITDFETQSRILDELHRLTWERSPKIWFGVQLLASYPNIRPQDLLRLKEGDIDLQYGVLLFWHPSKKRNQRKTTRLLPDHAKLFTELKARFPGMPNMPFFRHPAGIEGVKPDTPFGDAHLYNWMKRACSNLGIEGLDLYGATRHTTATGLSNIVGYDKAKDALGNTTNKASERYIQGQESDCLEYARIIERAQHGNVVKFGKK